MLVVLSFLTLAFCLVAGGFLTADCVSCEKREGTLGLLFLTPLTGSDVVWGKMACHGLRLLFGVCAVFPVFFLPLLTGGVTWPEVSRILLALLLALLLAASVGVFVSVVGTESRRTMMAAFASIVLVTAMPMAYLLARQIVLPVPTRSPGLPQLSPIYTILSALESGYTRAGGPALFWGSAGALFALSMCLVAASGLLVGLMVQAASKGSGRRRSRAAGFALSGLLERNPYEWTLLRGAGEAQSLGVLTHCFVGFFAAALIVSLTTPYWQAGFTAAFFTALAIHLITKLRFVVEVTRQISADRQSGAMELLLVTGLSEGSILEGHKRALRAVSRKPLMLLIGLNLVLELCVLLCPDQLHIDSGARVMFTSLFGGGMVLAAADFFALRQIGLLEGLRAASHLKAALRSFCSTMLPPWVAMGLLIVWMASIPIGIKALAAMYLVWVIVCVVYDRVRGLNASRQLEGSLRRLVSEGCAK